MMNRKNIALGAGAAAVALGLSLGATGMASATTTPSPSATPPVTAAAPGGDGTMKDGMGGRGHRGGVDAAGLATKLGVDEAAVTAALQAARDAAKAGAETQTGQKPDRAGMKAALVTSLAKALGLDEATVRTAVDELKAEKQGERAAAVRERLDAAVADGSLTRAEADGAAKALELGILGGSGERG